MRVTRVALVIVLTILSLPAAAQFSSDCPLTLAGTNEATTDFNLSPHGAFRDGAVLYVLRGQTLSAYTASDVGELEVIREEFIGALGSRDPRGGIAYRNGNLFVSGETGLEIWDVSDLGTGGGVPELVSRTGGLWYRRLAINGTTLVGLNPGLTLPCAPSGSSMCSNTLDIISISNLAAPTIVNRISSLATFGTVAFNDVAFNNGFLYAATESGIVGFNPAAPSVPIVTVSPIYGKYLVSDGMGVLGVGNDEEIHLYNVGPGGSLSRFAIFVIPFGMRIDRANPIAFHPQTWVDNANGRLITMVNEINPLTLEPARTLGFVVFDYGVPRWEGSYERVYEDITWFATDEVKYNPLAAGTSVFTVGELSGLQVWAGCGAPSGTIDWNGPGGLPCGGAELRGWITGPQRITNVEVFLDGESLGTALMGGPPRIDVSSKYPVHTWRLTVNLDQTTRGNHTIRAVATDALGVTRQFAEKTVFFNGPGLNCTNRRRSAR
jgi:hypothetical protein